MPITQAKTARNAVAVARGHDAIEMIAVPVGTGRQSAGHVMTIAGGRGTSEGAIHVAVNSIARKHRSWI